MMLFLSFVGFAYNNAISYWALQYTEALNALLIQSSGPLFVALWSLALFGIRLTGAQLAGITLSLLGVLSIILRGDFGALASIGFNRGDLMFASSLVSFALYSALIPRRPVTHALSLISFTTCCGALMLVPFAIWEHSTGATLKFDFISMATLGYAVIFPSTLAYLFFNRGLALIGPNRAAPFFHLVPVFGSAMAILLLGEQLRLFHLVGYPLVLAGVVIASRRASAKKA
jgi:drug/metabolite transporter (DMT)-like permease